MKGQHVHSRLDSLNVDASGGGVDKGSHADAREGGVIGEAEVDHLLRAAFGAAGEELLLIEPLPVANLVGMLAGSVLPADSFQRSDPAGQRAEQLPVGVLHPAIGKVVFLDFYRLETAADVWGEFQPQPVGCQQCGYNEREKKITLFHG